MSGKASALALSTLCSWAVAAGPACDRGPRASALQPVRHVVVVTVDTLRADHVGAYGGSVATPAMDELARHGVLFEAAFTPTPSTAPAHVSLFSGLHPWNHGVLDNAVPFEAEQLPWLAARAREAGFATAAFVSSYILAPRWGFDHGFDTYHFEPTRLASHERGTERFPFWNRGSETTRAALHWLEAHRDRPFFVWIHYFDPHSPYVPPPGYQRPRDEPVDLEGKTVPAAARTREGLAALIRGYRGDVAYSDAQLGALLDRLGRLGLRDDTVLVFTADHGEGLGDHGYMAHAHHLFEEQVRVPLMIAGPGLPRGRRLRGPAQLEDLMPTLLALMGIDVPESLDGVDLLPWVAGRTRASPRAAVLGQRAALPDRPLLFYQRRWPTKWIGELSGAGQTYRLDDDPREAAG
ncbi:MAG: sulfatase, partial [Myxococcota bacterium]